ncbi:meiosis-specific nuclear structural protein 1-like [Notothenia coriiceps]|uniref:Meiosis-specific nuclear structural protein 1-like n=1 Tax=Notothenia coriiceps TaxID=8208 RepID=A0A6I9NYM9_9TELE|nr:PREDICTED: meiosis-specific nuclear structural protein 1-like [Notothenia coriiceps]
MAVWKQCEFMSSDWFTYLNVMSDLIITFISLFKELEAKEKAIEEERQALRRQIIEEERQRLLKRHATKLLGYLPKGLLREDDLKHFDEDFRKNFEKRPADLSSEDGWEDDQ